MTDKEKEIIDSVTINFYSSIKHKYCLDIENIAKSLPPSDRAIQCTKYR
ncbi:MAG: hypothetical protein AABY32_01625 [Nanoarchaeota archaeon]